MRGRRRRLDRYRGNGNDPSARSIEPLPSRGRSAQPASAPSRLEHLAQTLILDREAVTGLRSCEHHATGQIVQHSLLEIVSQAQKPLDDRRGPHRRSSDGIRAQDNGKDQSWPRAAADSSRPRKESLLQSSTRTLASQAAQCSPTVPCPLNSLWGTGTARLLGFSRGSRLRSFDHIGSSRSAKSPCAVSGHRSIRATFRCLGRLTRRESSW